MTWLRIAPSYVSRSICALGSFSGWNRPLETVNRQVSTELQGRLSQVFCFYFVPEGKTSLSMEIGSTATSGSYLYMNIIVKIGHAQ